MPNFADQLTAARKAAGMTQEQLADAVHVARNTISSWEHGRTQPDLDTLRLLGQVLHFDFVNGETAPQAEAEKPAEAAPVKKLSTKRNIIIGAAALAAVILVVCLLIVPKLSEKPKVYKGDGSKEYLKSMHTFFDASIFTADFNNVEKDIGLWLSDKGVSQNTKLVPAESDVMTSINSYMLKASWNTALSADKANTKFTASNGSQTDAEFLSGNAERLLKSDKAQGFAKTFKGDHYAMAVLMPNEGVSVEDYLKSLTGKSVTSILSTAEEKNVSVSMPKITQTSDISVKEPLQTMGIKDAFDSSKADFSVMGKSNENMVLSDVVADTAMTIDANGVNATVANSSKNTVTKADATITVNRPFVYMIYDLEQNIPKFIGTYKKA
ncbi:MAG: helix-turn-helix domain-containing protein [Ruminococcus sp.]|nr:helix-turn-helix domain-containing protein [Ruminococcus sp.]